MDLLLPMNCSKCAAWRQAQPFRINFCVAITLRWTLAKLCYISVAVPKQLTKEKLTEMGWVGKHWQTDC